MTATFPLTGDAAADELLATEPFALLVGMLLDQQVPMEWAFHSPYVLKQRLGGRLDEAEIAGMDLDELIGFFSEKPPLHRYPKSMAERTQKLAQVLVDEFGGKAERVWTDAADGAQLFANVKSLPGFGDQKARIFIALLAKRMDVKPPGWEEAAGGYGQPGWFSVADIDGPDALDRVREHKKAMKAEAKGQAKAK